VAKLLDDHLVDYDLDELLHLDGRGMVDHRQVQVAQDLWVYLHLCHPTLHLLLEEAASELREVLLLGEVIAVVRVVGQVLDAQLPLEQGAQDQVGLLVVVELLQAVVAVGEVSHQGVDEASDGREGNPYDCDVADAEGAGAVEGAQLVFEELDLVGEGDEGGAAGGRVEGLAVVVLLVLQQLQLVLGSMLALEALGVLLLDFFSVSSIRASASMTAREVLLPMVPI
jgi:hypothetical protein